MRHIKDVDHMTKAKAKEMFLKGIELTTTGYLACSLD